MSRTTFSSVLSPLEVREVTGFKLHSKQIQALAMMGITYYTRPDGSPCVPRDALSPTDVKRKKTDEWVINM